MHNQLSKLIRTLALGVFFIAITPAFAGNNNWTGQFYLKGGHNVVHTPTQVIYDGSLSARVALSINGLYLRVDMSRPEFVAALIESGKYPA